MFRYLLLFSLFIFVSCGEPSSSRDEKLAIWMTQNGKKKILSTTQMVGYLVDEVGNGDVDSYTLIQGEHDPHSYQLVKGDSEKLHFADLIFYNGLGLEHGPSLEQYLEKSKNAHALGDVILKNYPDDIIYLDRAIDPHIWMDASLWNKTVPFIVEKLSEIVPEKKEEFEKRGALLQEKLKNAHKEIVKKLREIPDDRRYLVTTHDAFNYFARAYLTDSKKEDFRTRFQAPEGLAPDSQLSTADIQNLLTFIEKHNIKILFAESNVSRDSLKKLVDASSQRGYKVRIASKPLYADAVGLPGSNAENYKKMMLYNADEIHKELTLP